MRIIFNLALENVVHDVELNVRTIILLMFTQLLGYADDIGKIENQNNFKTVANLC